LGATILLVAIEKLGRQCGNRAIDLIRGAHLCWGDGLSAQRIAGVVMLEGLGIISAVLERLAEREMEMERILVGKLAAQGFAHGSDVPVGEAEGFEVGQCPPGFAVIGVRLNSSAKRGDGLVCSPDGFQRVAKRLPKRRIARVVGRQLLVDPDLPVVISQNAKGASLQTEDFETVSESE